MARNDHTDDTMQDRRLRRGWTLEDLAEQCTAAGTSVHLSTLGKIERGVQTPRPALRATLAQLLDLDAARDFDKAAS